MNEIDQNRLGYRISSDPDAMDLDAIHAYLSGSYWAQGISASGHGEGAWRLAVFRRFQINHPGIYASKAVGPTWCKPWRRTKTALRRG